MKLSARNVLAVVSSGLAIAFGLAAAWCQMDNHERAERLADVQRRLEMTEAAVEDLEVRVLSHVPGRAPRTSSRPASTSESHGPDSRGVDL